MRNQEYVVQQMREKKIREEALRSYEKEYYKPHFGPEETIERIN